MTEAFQWTCPRCDDLLGIGDLQTPDGSPLTNGSMLVCSICAAAIMCDYGIKGRLRGLSENEWRTLQAKQPGLYGFVRQKQAELLQSLTGHRRRRALLLPAFVAVKDVERR